jgi:thioredoxin-like negative regulator of GroEL
MSVLRDYKVTSMPHLILFKEGKEVATAIGYKGQENLEKFLKQ